MTKQHKESFSAGGIIVNPSGEICVVSNKLGKWSLPKGHIEDGEDALVAAKREILEESGIDQLDLIEKLGTYKRYRMTDRGEDKKSLKHITLFLFTTEQIELQSQDADNPVAKWISIAEAAQILTHPKDKEYFTECVPAIEKLLKKISRKK